VRDHADPWEVTITIRAVRHQLLAGVLGCSGVLLATLLVYGQKNENNPDKIGHRTVAHKSIISPEKEREVGKQEAEQFERSVELVQDPVVEQYVTTVSGSVVSHSDWKGQVTVKVVKSSEVSGFSLPGGFIYLSSGLLLAAENEDEIAGAIAHQVAHAAARHWASQMTKATLMQYATIPLIFTPTVVCSGSSGRDRVRVGVPVAFLKFQRQNEMEADYLGLQYMYKAGYDPSAYVALLARLAPKDAASQSLPDAFRATPPVSERIAKAEEEIHKKLPNAAQPKSGPEFVLMKSRL
jgi:predicted Zn-dependent protease